MVGPRGLSIKQALRGVALGTVALLAAATPAAAATIKPSTKADQFNTEPGKCSLREAVQAANTDAAFGGCPAGSGADLIQLGAGVYQLSFPGNESNNVNGDLDVLGTLTVLHAGAAPAAIDGGGVDKVFTVLNGANLTVSRLAIRNGSSDINGGGIRNTGALTLTNATVSGNRSALGGGGITSFNSGTLTLTNVTISGNRADASGGGINVSNGTATFNNVTITGNTADNEANGSGNGGGISEGTANVQMGNTILSGNFDRSGDNRAKNCEGNYTTTGHTQFGSQAMFFSDCLITFVPNQGDIFDQDVALLGLANNGGPAPTHGLPFGSTAVGLGGDDCVATDQRGVPRSLAPPCDVGAYERVGCAGKIVNRVGTAGRDKLKGTKKADGILGLDGRDVLRGLGGRDSLCGGRGRDRLFGGRGIDKLRGGPGRDFLRQ